MNHNRLPELRLLQIPQPNCQETIKKLLALGAKKPVTLTMNVTLPIHNWQDLANIAESQQVTLERAIAMAVVNSDWFVDESTQVQNQLWEQATAKALVNSVAKLASTEKVQGSGDPYERFEDMLEKYGLTSIVHGSCRTDEDTEWQALAKSHNGSLFEVRDDDSEPRPISLSQAWQCFTEIMQAYRNASFGDAFEQWLELVGEALGQGEGGAQ